MSDRLRQTSTEYDREIESIELQIKSDQERIDNAKARLADVKAAKKILDDQIDKLPKPKPATFSIA